MTTHQNAVSVFLSYAHEDEPLLKELEKHLSLLKQQGLISSWYDRQIVPGTNWAEAIDERLEQASIILLLVSSDFLASDYCSQVEVKRALERHEAGETRVIPLVMRPVDWKGAPFAHLQALPTDAKAVTIWDNRDQAFVDIVTGIRRAIEDLSLLPARVLHAALPAIWNIPYPRNPFFIGRDDLLSHLHTQLQAGQTMALSQPQAISGLGGVGKTQIAVEYAYRYARDYQAILWTRADSREALVSSFIELAIILNLPERDERDQRVGVAAVLRWLRTHTQWLLILDNVDDLSLFPNFLPPAGTGHVVLTTRAQALGGLASRIEVNTMDQETGMRLLLQRAGLLPLDAPLAQAAEKDLSVAVEICQELGGLPLALDQAGAYIEETSCALSDYLDLYRIRRAEILKRRGGLLHDHPDPVATTWSLSLAAIEQRQGKAAVDLLHICAFCAPDAIPEELLREGSPYLGSALSACASDPIIWNAILATVGAYSLLQRNSAEKTLSLHRLVQAVLQDALPESERKQWLERLIAAINAVFPEVEPTTWRQCERLVPHALMCASQTQSWKHANLDLASVLFKTAQYLTDRGQYTEAEPLFQRALRNREQALGPEHLELSYPLNDLANLYREQSKYTEAESLFQQALHIREQALGPEHPLVAYPLNDLAGLYRKQGRYTEAELLFQRALRIREQALGPEHLQVARSLNGLANLYREQGRYAEAEPLFQRALRIREQALGSEHPELSYPLNGLGKIYREQGRYAEAEPLFQRALHLWEQVLGPEHPLVARPLSSLAQLYVDQGRYTEAEPLYQRSLRIREQRLGLDHPEVAYALGGLAHLYTEQARYAEAESLYRQVLSILKQAMGHQHPDTAEVLHDFARFQHIQGNVQEASALYQQALAIREQALGAQHGKTRETRKHYATLLRELDRHDEEAPSEIPQPE